MLRKENIFKNKIFIFAMIFFLGTFCLSLVTCKKSSNKTKEAKIKIIASTSWTAAFADLAGVESIDVIAPATLIHPPEYEVTVSDINKILESDYFIFAGFERMMKTLGENVASSNMIKITCNNSLENVKSQVLKIAKICGDQNLAKERLASFESVIVDGKKNLESIGKNGAKVFCNKNQIYLAKDLGLEIVAVFGPGEVTSKDIQIAKTHTFDFIIDNVHNPVGKPLTEVNNSKYLVWRNFPEKVENGALEKVIKNNIQALIQLN